MTSWLPKEFKRKAKSHWKSLGTRLLRSSRGFSYADLLQLLRRVGVMTGDTVLVHSSFDRFAAFLGKPTEIIAVLQEAVGNTGTLLMPTLPFTGTAVEYVKKGLVFDVKKTPSQMGFLTEMFRRSSGVVRSVHPTHAVAAWGRLAVEMVRDHAAAGTPCGRLTPYGRLLEHDGKILFLGTDISVMTFFHAVEEILEPRLPFSPFTREIYSVESRDEYGNLVVSNMRLFEPHCSRRRNLGKLVPVLKKRGWWHEAHRSGLTAIVLKAAEVLEATTMLASQRIYCYDD
jgi:aminoglycoside 3-N-acetyltransferase